MPSRKSLPKKLIEIDAEFQRRLYYLVTMWANAETWFMRILTVLMRTDVGRGDLIFSSMTSSRARIDLVLRAAIMCLATEDKLLEFESMHAEFKKITKTRNRVCHAQYIPDPTGAVLVGLMTVDYQRRDFDGTNHRQTVRLDRNFLNEVKQAGQKASALCDRLEAFAKSCRPQVLKRPRDTPLRLRGNR